MIVDMVRLSQSDLQARVTERRERACARLSVSHPLIEDYLYVAMDLVMTGRRNLKNVFISVLSRMVESEDF